MSNPQNFTFQTDNYDLAYRTADARPGEIIEFCGKLPCDDIAFQKIVTVKRGGNGYAEIDRLAENFKGAKVLLSSSMERGTHIIATFGGTKPEAYFS